MPGQWGRLSIQVLPNPLCSNSARIAAGMCPEPQGCSGCFNSQHSSKDLGRAAAHSVLSPSCPEATQCLHGVPGDGANHPCRHPVSSRAAHTHPLRWHLGEALGEVCPAPPGGIWHRGLQVQGTCCLRLREGLSSSKPRVESGSQRPLPAAALPGGWSPRAQGHGVAGAGPRRDWEAALHSPGGKWVITRAGSASLQSYDSAGSRACCASHRPPDGPEG